MTKSTKSSRSTSRARIEEQLISNNEQNYLLHNPEDQISTHGSIEQNPQTGHSLSSDLKTLIKQRLYVSHFLYVWNSRMYEFGIVLFIINLYPGTLFPSSLFAFCSSLSGILLSNTVTNLVNHGERLKIIKKTITIQRSFAVLSATVLLVIFQFFNDHSLLKKICLLIVIICGVVEKLSTIANKISISRDWIVKICSNDDVFLVELNTKLRSIDLFCKLVAPFFISSFITFAGFKIALIFIILTFFISNQIEFSMILKIYHSIPILKESEDQITKSAPKFKPLTYWESLKLFTRNPLALQILSISCVYLTVLSFGNTTIAYLLSFDDINNFSIGLLKGVSTAFELFGTLFIFPFLHRFMSFTNVGFVSVLFQMLSLVPILVSFIIDHPRTHWLICFCIPWSRIGLWCFDLAVQNSIQVYITDDFQRFNATTFEESLNNFFELSAHILTLVFHRPDQFKYSAFASIGAVLVAVLLYLTFIIIVSRKHLDFSK